MSFRGNSRGGRGGSARSFNQGPPDQVVEMGLFLHPCEGEMVCAKSPNQSKIPYFNAPIFLENKTQIGKIDEILGPINEVYFTVKLSEGVLATSFKKNDKVYIGTDKLLPLDRFLPKPKGAKVEKPTGRQGMNGSSGRGGSRGGRGGPRGGFSSRGGRGGPRGGGFSRGGSRGGPRGGSSRGGSRGGRGRF